MPITVTKENFTQTVEQSAVPVLLDFWAAWCGPCRMFAPVLEETARELGDSAVIGKVNIDEQPELASRFGVLSVPTVLVFREGRPGGRLVGVQDKATLVRLLRP